MEPEFWRQHWQANKVGWHEADVNPHLIRFWPELQPVPDSTVLVPLRKIFQLQPHGPMPTSP